MQLLTSWTKVKISQRKWLIYSSIFMKNVLQGQMQIMIMIPLQVWKGYLEVTYWPNERAYSAQLALHNGMTEFSKLQCVIHRPEGLHRMMNLLLVSMCLVKFQLPNGRAWLLQSSSCRYSSFRVTVQLN